MRIAKYEIESAVILGRPGFGGDFYPSSAGARKLRRVRILVDLYFFNRRWRHTQVRHFHSIHDQRHSIRPDTPGIEKARHRDEVILIKHWQVAERLLIQRHCVLVVGGFGADLGRRSCDRSLLPQAGDCQRNLQRRDRLCIKRHIHCSWIESSVGDLNLILTRRNSPELEIS